jgi:hypothetical protein
MAEINQYSLGAIVRLKPNAAPGSIIFAHAPIVPGRSVGEIAEIDGDLATIEWVDEDLAAIYASSRVPLSDLDLPDVLVR